MGRSSGGDVQRVQRDGDRCREQDREHEHHCRWRAEVKRALGGGNPGESEPTVVAPAARSACTRAAAGSMPERVADKNTPATKLTAMNNVSAMNDVRRTIDPSSMGGGTTAAANMETSCLWLTGVLIQSKVFTVNNNRRCHETSVVQTILWSGQGARRRRRTLDHARRSQPPPRPAPLLRLLRGLPGITTNLLAKRLREMEQLDLIERVNAPGVDAGHVYRLTALGAGLEPAVHALDVGDGSR